uniref:Disease resistance R13L4/SHOC-2-like LRR domain-containing protein n=1 Tax=Caenorhabditis tropicalis TaxID=1561998 RepID=A0A1I7TS32_9PELO
MLKHLDLSINYLTQLPTYIGSMTHLKQLNLARNQFEFIPSEVGFLVNLEVLNVSQNKMSELPDLSKCIALKTVEATENQFIVFPTGICQCPSLETCIFTENRIERLPDEIHSLRAVSVILNKNRLLSLNTANLLRCERLRAVNVDDNQLNRDEIENFVVNAPREIRVSFERNVSQLHTTDLQEMGNDASKTKSIGDNARKLIGKSGPSTSTVNKHLEMASKSRILQLKGTGLKKVPEEIEQLADVLRNLELSENKIREIPPFIGQFTQLKQLHLSNNCLESLPDEIGSMKKLEILNLAGNNLQSLPDTIVGCIDLRTLDISSNSFTQFPVALVACVQLDILNMNGNQIEKLPDEISDLKVIELSLNQNRLVSLNASNLAKAQRMRTLRLDENCLEKSEFTKEILESSSISVISYDGNRFQLKDFQDLPGYEAYQERFTATKRKI